MFDYAWIILALPAAAVLINLFFGTVAQRASVAIMASTAIGLAFLATDWFLYAELGLLAEEREITVTLWEWITIGSFQVKPPC